MSTINLEDMTKSLKERGIADEEYVQTVEVIFPQKLAEDVGYSAIVVPISRLLKLLSKDIEGINPEHAAELQCIAAQYYADDDGVDVDDDWPEVDMDRLEILARDIKSPSETHG